MSDKNKIYDESKVKTLSPLEHIRLRSGMYIGRLGDGSNPEDGIYVLLKEVIDNGVDEYIMGFGAKIEIVPGEEGEGMAIRDYGRGIPLGKIEECVSHINTGAKYNDDVFQFSVGLNGVGLKAVNALSEKFVVRGFRNGKYAEVAFERGKLVGKKDGKTDEPDGTFVQFLPDVEIFGDFTFNGEFIESRLFNYACLNRALVLFYGKKRFVSKRGLMDLLTAEVGEEGIYSVRHYSGEHLEFAFTHTSGYGETHFSFVNGQHTADGGSHLSAFREGFLKGVNEYYRKNYTGQDVRESMAGAVSIKIKDPVFESQTKNKLGNSEIRSWIVAETKEAVSDILHKNKDTALKLEEKIRSSEQLRKELASVRKEAKEASRKIALNIPKLKDCKFHKNDTKKRSETMIFVTEGQSATGSIVSCRDVNTQAIYSLRGKPWNSFGKKRTEIYRNEELFNLMAALGIDTSIDGLRYDRIILATDADDDGYHIRNLILTFLLNFFEELVLGGHIFILETPLFRVRNTKETRYCYSSRERDKAVKEIKNPETTRFKGLGEISPKEFGAFIGTDMRLVPVTLQSLKSVPEILSFYMGKNTPERRDYIMDNLL